MERGRVERISIRPIIKIDRCSRQPRFMGRRTLGLLYQCLKQPRGLTAYLSDHTIGMNKDPHAFYHTGNNSMNFASSLWLKTTPFNLCEDKGHQDLNQKKLTTRHNSSQEIPFRTFSKTPPKNPEYFQVSTSPKSRLNVKAKPSQLFNFLPYFPRIFASVVLCIEMLTVPAGIW